MDKAADPFEVVEVRVGSPHPDRDLLRESGESLGLHVYDSASWRILARLDAPADRAVLGEGPIKFALVLHKSIVCLLAEAGDMTWEMPAGVYREKRMKSEGFSVSSSKERKPIAIEVVDATATVTHLRLVTLSPYMTRLMLKNLRRVAESPPSAQQWQADVLDMQSQFPSARDAWRSAVTSCRAGD